MSDELNIQRVRRRRLDPVPVEIIRMAHDDRLNEARLAKMLGVMEKAGLVPPRPPREHMQ